MIASTQTNHPLAGVASVNPVPNPLDEACLRLREAGLRITKPRIAILTALIHRGQPTSIEQIHDDLADGSCDLVTVYRCLAAFEEIGLVRRSFYHNGTSLYQFGLGGSSRYHVVSRNTNTVEEIDAESAEELRATVQRIEERLRARGYTDVTHVVEFFSSKQTLDRSQRPAQVR
jgi:Fur family ferric uptake transcriptional regulator